jgi:hypothetical protein
MNAAMQTLYWRVANEKNTELDAVSVLMPQEDSGSSQVALEYPVDVSFKPSKQHSNPIDLRWSEEDVELFLALLNKVMDFDQRNIELDIEDRTIQGIIHLVATARFQTPYPADEIEGEDFITYRRELDVGDLVALNTHYGFVSAVIVDLDSIDATCILLDEVVDENDEVLLPGYQLLMMNRSAVLPAEFGDEVEPEVLH